MEPPTAPTPSPVLSTEELETCLVCGDDAKYGYYGAMTCLSCKAFFKRTVEIDKNTLAAKCLTRGKCEVKKLNDGRNICRFCRLQKCLQVGMTLEKQFSFYPPYTTKVQDGNHIRPSSSSSPLSTSIGTVTQNVVNGSNVSTVSGQNTSMATVPRHNLSMGTVHHNGGAHVVYASPEPQNQSHSSNLNAFAPPVLDTVPRQSIEMTTVTQKGVCGSDLPTVSGQGTSMATVPKHYLSMRTVHRNGAHVVHASPEPQNQSVPRQSIEMTTVTPKGVSGSVVSTVSGQDPTISTVSRQDENQKSKICLVCGADAKCLHLGVMSCDACKTFFRSNFQQDKKTLAVKCLTRGNCEINKQTHGSKMCRFCRLQKCFQVGMTLKRKRFFHSPYARKVQDGNHNRPSSTSSPLSNSICTVTRKVVSGSDVSTVSGQSTSMATVPRHNLSMGKVHRNGAHVLYASPEPQNQSHSSNRNAIDLPVLDTVPRQNIQMTTVTQKVVSGSDVSTVSRQDKSNKSNICLVCGDEAKTLHFGVLSCDACKTFFRANFQQDMNTLAAKCLTRGNCKINKQTHGSKMCRSCRLQKCLQVGMIYKVTRMKRSYTPIPPSVMRNENWKICLVCGDYATCVNHGVVSCDGCKTFFSRTLSMDKNILEAECLSRGKCEVKKQNDGSYICRFCRFQKCLQVGMNQKRKLFSHPPYARDLQDVNHNRPSSTSSPLSNSMATVTQKVVSGSDVSTVSGRDTTISTVSRQDKIPPMGPPVTLTPSSVLSNKKSKICEVCGDEAKCFDSRVISCDDCKTFYDRTNRMDISMLKAKCLTRGKCEVKKQNDGSNICRFCRFQKCFQVGMNQKGKLAFRFSPLLFGMLTEPVHVNSASCEDNNADEQGPMGTVLRQGPSNTTVTQPFTSTATVPQQGTSIGTVTKNVENKPGVPRQGSSMATVPQVTSGNTEPMLLTNYQGSQMAYKKPVVDQRSAGGTVFRRGTSTATVLQRGMGTVTRNVTRNSKVPRQDTSMATVPQVTSSNTEGCQMAYDEFGGSQRSAGGTVLRQGTSNTTVTRPGTSIATVPQQGTFMPTVTPQPTSMTTNLPSHNQPSTLSPVSSYYVDPMKFENYDEYCRAWKEMDAKWRAECTVPQQDMGTVTQNVVSDSDVSRQDTSMATVPLVTSGNAEPVLFTNYQGCQMAYDDPVVDQRSAGSTVLRQDTSIATVPQQGMGTVTQNVSRNSNVPRQSTSMTTVPLETTGNMKPVVFTKYQDCQMVPQQGNPLITVPQQDIPVTTSLSYHNQPSTSSQLPLESIDYVDPALFQNYEDYCRACDEMAAKKSYKSTVPQQDTFTATVTQCYTRDPYVSIVPHNVPHSSNQNPSTPPVLDTVPQQVTFMTTVTQCYPNGSYVSTVPQTWSHSTSMTPDYSDYGSSTGSTPGPSVPVTSNYGHHGYQTTDVVHHITPPITPDSLGFLQQTIRAYNASYVYSLENVSKIVPRPLSVMTSETHAADNRLRAWQVLVYEMETDIEESMNFLCGMDQIGKMVDWHDKIRLLKSNYFEMSMFRWSRGFTDRGLLLRDGRLIDIPTLELIYGEPLTKEVEAFAKGVSRTMTDMEIGLAAVFSLIQVHTFDGMSNPRAVEKAVNYYSAVVKADLKLDTYQDVNFRLGVLRQMKLQFKTAVKFVQDNSKYMKLPERFKEMFDIYE